MPKLDPDKIPDPRVLYESFEHPHHGWMDYDPNTMAIRQPVGKPITKPVGVPEQFWNTKQPQIPTCSEPREGNVGCPKWHGCPLKGYPYVGPGMLIMERRGAVSAVDCFDYFSERDAKGQLVYQTNWIEHGWRINNKRTTMPVMGSTPVMNQFGQKTSETIRKEWQMEITGLLPYYWPLLKKKGLPIPDAARMYPELLDQDEPPPAPKKRGRPRKPIGNPSS